MRDLVGRELILDELRKTAGVEFVAQIGPKILELKLRIEQQNRQLNAQGLTIKRLQKEIRDAHI